VEKPRPVRAGGTGLSADLGGSSKYSNENFEDRSGERFRANSGWTRVSRSLEIGRVRFKGPARSGLWITNTGPKEGAKGRGGEGGRRGQPLFPFFFLFLFFLFSGQCHSPLGQNFRDLRLLSKGNEVNIPQPGTGDIELWAGEKKKGRRVS